jgi:hypothetical protein
MRTMRCFPRPAARPVVAIALLGLVLGGCGPPSHRYVRNTEQRTAFKLPADWTVYDEQQLLGQGETASADTPDPREWLVGFDADPSPSIAHVVGSGGSFATDYPSGIAAVFRLSPQQRDQVSLGQLRNLIVPIDTIVEELGQEAVRVLAYDDRLMREGFRGLHLEFQVLESAIAQVGDQTGSGLLNDTYVHVSQTAYLDETTDRVYVFAVMCSAECFARNRGEIQTAVDSWTVLPR